MPTAAPRQKQAGSSAFPGGARLWVELLHPGVAGAVPPTTNDVVVVHYATLLARTGRLVDSTRAGNQRKRALKPMTIILGTQQVVDGMDEGLRRLTLGALARLHCPAHLGYGASGNGNAVPPNADLVFEVELVAVNGACVKGGGLKTLELRCLLTSAPASGLPPPSSAAPPAGAALVQSEEQRAVMQAALTAAKAVRARRRQLGARNGMPPGCRVGGTAAATYYESDLDIEVDDDDEKDERCASEAGRLVAESTPATCAWPWLQRLCPPTRPGGTHGARYDALLPEQRHLLELIERVGVAEFRRALRGAGAGGSVGGAQGDQDGARILLPGSMPIRRARYHDAKWDSRTPLILTGERRQWPWFRRGWRYWGEAFADEMVTASQRAPIFDSDQWEATVVSEVTWAEYVAYARGVHKQSPAEQRETPLLYANGWELFSHHPELWEFDFDKISSTIENLTAYGYREALGQMGMPTDEAHVQEQVSHYCKLFVAPRGACTRMHQDNHHAHAWLSQVRG